MSNSQVNLGKFVDAVRERGPLVHNITNYVTVNDCANALLAAGASPIMSDEPEDVRDITSICNALTINIGTLNQQSIKAMQVAGERSAELNHSIVLDPVGAGASTLRTQTAAKLLDTLPITVIRGNMSEAKALATGSTTTRGVDVCPDDVITKDNVKAGIDFAKELASKTGALVAITGPVDIVADETQAYAVFNGSTMQERLTGAGCMLSCLTAAYASISEDERLEAVLASVVSMGLAGQIAEERMQNGDGNGSYRTYLLDALYTMTGSVLNEGARIEAF